MNCGINMHVQCACLCCVCIICVEGGCIPANIYHNCLELYMCNIYIFEIASINMYNINININIMQSQNVFEIAP